jgi:hypothetical protein
MQGRVKARHCEARSAEAVPAQALASEFATNRYAVCLTQTPALFALDCFGATLRVVLAMTDPSFS